MSTTTIMYTLQPLSALTAVGGNGMTDLQTMRGLGIDVVMNYYYTDVDPSSSGAIALLNAYQAAGLKGLIRLGPSYTQKVMGSGDYTALTNFVNALKNHPALYGWYTNDEPALSGSSVDYPNGQILTVYNAIKAADPNHPTVIVYPGYGPNFWPAGSGAVAYPYSPSNQDLFGIDTYPIDGSGGYSRMAAESLGNYAGTRAEFQRGIADSITQVTDHTQTFFVMQTYVNGVGIAQPSGARLTEMAADAAAAGWTSRGIAFWMWDWYGNGGVSCLKNNPAAWSDVSTIAAQYSAAGTTSSTTTSTTPQPTSSSTSTSTTSTTTTQAPQGLVISVVPGNESAVVSVVSMGRFAGSIWDLRYGPDTQYMWGGSGTAPLAVGVLGTVAGLTNGVPCNFQLTSYNSTETDWDSSNIVTVTPTIPVIVADSFASGGTLTEAFLTLIIPPPGVSQVDIEPGNRKLTLRWPPVDTAVKYNVYWTADGTDPNALSSKFEVFPDAADEIIVNGLTNGGVYKFTVAAVSAQGKRSALSPVVTGIPRIIDPLRFLINGVIVSFEETPGGPLRFCYGGRVFEFAIGGPGVAHFNTPAGVVTIPMAHGDVTIPHDMFSTGTLDDGTLIGVLGAEDLASGGSLNAAFGSFPEGDLISSSTLDVASLVGALTVASLISDGTLDSMEGYGGLAADSLTSSGTLDAANTWIPTATVAFTNFS